MEAPERDLQSSTRFTISGAVTTVTQVSHKPQASLKPQAKLQAPRPTKPQAASRKHNPKPQALASRTLEKVSETSDRGL